jgi:hypothetical protein
MGGYRDILGSEFFRGCGRCFGPHGQIQQTLVYRCRLVYHGLGHYSDSMYGFITFATRQTLAASHSSFIVAFFWR